MLDSIDTKSPHPRALKAVLVLGAIVVLVLLVVRIAGLFALVADVLSGGQLLLVAPGIPGDFWLAVGTALTLLAFLLPVNWRKPAWIALFIGTLLLVAVSGSQTTPGGAGISGSPVGHWLRARGYARCPAQDQVHHGLHSITLAEGWAQAGACTGTGDTKAGGDKQRR